MALYKDSKHYNAKAIQILNAVESAMNEFSIAGGHGPAVVTCGWRPPRPGHPSFHPKHQAKDFRCNDKSDDWIDGVVHIIKAFKCVDYHVEYQIHGDGQNIHIHVEYDTGDPI